MMKEDDPTVLENGYANGNRNSNGSNSNTYTNNDISIQSSPTRTNMISLGQGAWTPLKDEPMITAVPTATDTEYEVSPTQYLMSDTVSNGNNKYNSNNNYNTSQRLRQSDALDVDGDDNDDNNDDKQKKYRTKTIWITLLILIILMLIAGIVVAVIFLRDSNSSSSKSSSSNNNNNELPGNNNNNTKNTPTPTIISVVPTPTLSPVVSIVPSMFVNDTSSNNTNTNTTTDVPTLTPLDVTNTTFMPTIVSSNTTGTPTTFTNTSITTLSPTLSLNVTTTSPTILVSNTSLHAVKLSSILDIALVSNDRTILQSDSTSIYSKAYTYMISSDTYYINTLSTMTTMSSILDTQIFQRYIVIVLSILLFKPVTDTTQVVPVAVNPITDHCTWIGIVCNTNTTDTIVDNVITDLVWSEYSLYGTIPNTIQYLSSLTKLDFGTNELIGTIPNEIYYNLTSLQYLYLHDNQLIGTLSNDGLGQLSLLQHLYLGDNLLTGTLPQNLGSPGPSRIVARNLTFLSLYNNSFIGTIPLNWNLANLFYLDLGHNQLSGSIPFDWIDDMFSLSILYLNHNKLSGSFPTNFQQIGNNRLWLLQVNDNFLTGIIPSGFNERQLDLTEFQHNNFTSMDILLCNNIVFNGGEMISMRSDCGATCPCTFFCGDGECYV